MKNISANAISDDGLENVAGGWSWNNKTGKLTGLCEKDVASIEKSGFSPKAEFSCDGTSAPTIGFFDANGNRATDRDLYNILKKQ